MQSEISRQLRSCSLQYEDVKELCRKCDNFVDGALKALERTASSDANDPQSHSVADIGRLKRRLRVLRDNLRKDLVQDDSHEERHAIMVQYIRDVQRLLEDLTVFRQGTVSRSSTHTTQDARNEDRRPLADTYHGGRHAPKAGDADAAERERKAWVDIADREKDVAEREKRAAWRERQAVDLERQALAKTNEREKDATEREKEAARHEREALERERQTLLIVANRERKLARREHDTADWERKVAERHSSPIIYRERRGLFG
jgi:hypothetical protein